MKLKIPDSLKADVPQTFWGRVLTATPIVMTVIATMLAGLASSEMTRAQYSRSLAAQQQSKAGDQWGYFQAKRLRGTMQRSTIDILEGIAEVRPLDPEAVMRAVEQAPALDAPECRKALELMRQGRVPEIPEGSAVDPKIKPALEAVAASKPEAEVSPLLAPVSVPMLDEALRSAQDRAQALDAATKPVNQAIDAMENYLAGRPDRELSRSFVAARLSYTAARYDAEARFNQAIANVYELMVRKGNIEAERHHKRSQRFFYGMLAAQAAVIIATFSIAAHKRNLLWALAAAAGAAAVFFAVYVYLFV